MTTLTSDPIAGVCRRPERRRASRAAWDPAANGLDGDYWLRHCEGYRVDGSEGRIGFVDSIREEADGGTILAVRAGRLGMRLLLIRSRDVAFIVPRAERIWLAAPTEIVGSEAAWSGEPVGPHENLHERWSISAGDALRGTEAAAQPAISAPPGGRLPGR